MRMYASWGLATAVATMLGVAGLAVEFTDPISAKFVSPPTLLTGLVQLNQ